MWNSSNNGIGGETEQMGERERGRGKERKMKERKRERKKRKKEGQNMDLKGRNQIHAYMIE